MSDPVICKKCGAESYNETGSTHLSCWDCYLKAVERAEKAEDKILTMEMTATEKEEQSKEMLAMLEELEWSGEGELTNGDRITFCPICERCFGVHTEDCKLGNLLAKVRGNGII
jgi:uncharacterized Zn finger protein (UPF0148 family)